MSLAEKFQITIRAPEEKEEGWVEARSQRVHTGITPPGDGEKFNHMPPGYDATSCKDQFVQGFGGNTDVSAQGAFDADFFRRGYKKRELKATDDQYTGEHVDLFYGDAGGFVERNNYMDRE